MSKLRKNLLQHFQLIVFSATYSLSWILLFIAVMLLLRDLDLVFKVFIAMALLIAGVITGCYLFILFSIPHKLAGAFDPLKNRVSTGVTSDVRRFSSELSAFLISFFNYSFFDVRYSMVKTNDMEPAWSDPQLQDVLPWDEIGHSAAGSEDVLYNGRIKIGNQTVFAYTVPLWFDDRYLGYFTIFSMQSLGPLRKNILADLENNYIDDQIVRLMPPSYES